MAARIRSKFGAVALAVMLGLATWVFIAEGIVNGLVVLGLIVFLYIGVPALPLFAGMYLAGWRGRRKRT